MSFDIEFDYRFDTAGFFDNPEARAALEAAAGIWESVIGDEFEAVPSGIAFYVSNPTDGTAEQIVLDEDIDDLLIFVGASTTPFGISVEEEPAALPEGYSCGCALCCGEELANAGALARAGYSGYGASGDALNARITSNFRGQGPATDFEPYAGVMGVNTSYTWNFDIEQSVPGEFDFLTVAVHEIGHVLGIGTAHIFDDWIANGAFQGPNASLANGESPVPLHGDNSHVAAGHNNNSVVMDPSIGVGQRVPLSEIDKALLADIGYEIEGYAKQGTTFEITTNGDDSPVFGTIVADVIDGLNGNDQIQGNDGDDTLMGGAGGDSLFGQDGADLIEGESGEDFLLGGSGNDLLVGGTGNDTLYGDAGVDRFAIAPGEGQDTIGDFDFAAETLLISPDFGFGSVEEILGTLSKPFSNVSRLQLAPSVSLEIFHSSQSGSPLTEANIEIAEAEPENRAPAAAPDTAETQSGQTVVIDVLANDTDPDGDPLTISALGTPFGGSLEIIEGQLHYTANPGFTGLDQFDYGISDGRGGGSGSFVSVTVTAPGELREGDAGANGISTGAGDDTLSGFAGDDTLSGGAGADVLHGGGDHDRLFGEDGDDRLTGGSGRDTLLGQAGNDRLVGDTNDGLTGQADLLNGGAGDDLLFGDGGSDTLHGEDGDDSLEGGAGFDLLNGNDGDDSLDGGTEADTLRGHTGADTLSGGAGNDVLNGDAGADSLEGGPGRDRIDGGSEADSLAGGEGIDTLTGGTGADSLAGGTEGDVLRGGTGADTLAGEDGDDRLYGEGDADSLDGGLGNDLLFGSAGADTLLGGAGTDTLKGGSEGDSLEGGADADRLIGEDGDDRLSGDGGDDRLDGSAGADTLTGGEGRDTLLGGADGDDLGGGAGVDVLRGQGGDDTLAGGAGDDRLGGDAGADLFLFAPGDGKDLIFDFTSGTDLIRISGGAASFAELVISTDGQGRARIAYSSDPEDEIILAGVSGAGLSDNGDFEFV